jgi:putative PIN family toxin of toxin-antitoxin system
VIRAVIDTNVLVSGLLTPNGNEALIILAIHQGYLHPCCSEEILAEYVAVLARPKFAFEPDEIGALLAMLREKGELIQPIGPCPALPSPMSMMENSCTARNLHMQSLSLPAISGTFHRNSAAKSGS